MNDTDFWQIIESARQQSRSLSDVDHIAEKVVDLLSERSLQDIVTFAVILRTKMAEANQPELYAAVEWIFRSYGVSEVSGDAWEYFRAWPIAQGQKSFARVLQKPDNLADDFTTFDEFLGGESLLHAPQRVCRVFLEIEPPDEMYEPGLIESFPESPTEPIMNFAKRFPKIAAILPHDSIDH